MLSEVPFSITNASGDTLRGDIRMMQGSTRAPVVLVCHGFTAHKDWGPFPFIGRRFAEAGFVSIVFNFSHNGVGADSRRFTEREKFAGNTVGKELEDLRAVVDAVAAGVVGGGTADPSRVFVVGHSRGGGIAILGAKEDERIRGIAAWSTIATFYRYTAHQRSVWERDGFLPVTIRGLRTRLRLDVAVLRDLEEHRARYDLREAARTLGVPLLLIHGSADAAVRAAEAEELYAAGESSRTELVLLDGAGHSLGATHPFRSRSPALDQAIDLSARWFQSIT
ncbi:MAG: alpha/beta fold hydrolase [Bacteroidota bacterium]